MKRRIVSLVEENPSAELIIFDYRASLTARWVRLFLHLPGKFNPLTVVDGFYPAIHFSTEPAKLKIYRSFSRYTGIISSLSFSRYNILAGYFAFIGQYTISMVSPDVSSSGFSGTVESLPPAINPVTARIRVS
jgi:hypothetical protein